VPETTTSVPRDVQELIGDLSTNPKFVGECPSCKERFKLRDAGIFYFDNLTGEAKSARQSLEDQILQMKQDYNDLLQRIKIGAAKTSLAVNVGKAVEKVAPALPTFPHTIGDCRFLGEPIDYLVFGGIVPRGRIEELVFLDIKTGKARLTDGQKLIKDAVERHKVELALY
jgi:predicted Holliday junction resolvase-like endonuclease